MDENDSSILKKLLMILLIVLFIVYLASGNNDNNNDKVNCHIECVYDEEREEDVCGCAYKPSPRDDEPYVGRE